MSMGVRMKVKILFIVKNKHEAFMFLLFLISPRECVLIFIVKARNIQILPFLSHIYLTILKARHVGSTLMGFLAGISKLANKKL